MIRFGATVRKAHISGTVVRHRLRARRRMESSPREGDIWSAARGARPDGVLTLTCPYLSQPLDVRGDLRDILLRLAQAQFLVHPSFRQHQ